jgi:hypothetical protein
MPRIRRRTTIATCLALAFVAVFLTLVLTHSGRAKPSPTEGGFNNDGIAPAIYYTSINIHNPALAGNAVTIYKRAVVALPESASSTPPSPIQTYSLSPGYAVEVDCEDIVGLLNISPWSTFIEGYVSVFSRRPLDVVGIYSSDISLTPPITLDLQNVLPRIEGAATIAPTAAEPGTILEYSAKFLCGPPPTV